jgi:hypothetical protein
VTNQQISSAPGEFTIEFAKTLGGDPLIAAGMAVYVGGRAESFLNRPKVWTHVFQTYSRQSYLDLNAYYNSTKVPLVWVRFGIKAAGQGQMTDWEPHTIVDLRSTPSRTPDSAHGDFFTMVTADLLYIMGKDERVMSYKGKVSAMVQLLATNAGFTKFSIEPTDLDYALIQPFQTDYAFLSERLVPLAASAAGESNYLTFARGEFFHFHTLNYQLDGLYKLDYGITTTPTDLTIANVGNNNAILGINGVKLVAYDPLAGTTTNWETNPSRELDFADSAPSRAGTVYAARHVGQNQLASLYAESQWKFSNTKNGAFELAVTVDNFPFVGVGTVVDTSIQSGQGDLWEGFYAVKGVTHTIDNMRVTTRYILNRGEYATTGGDGDAPGKKLNAAGLNASGLTSASSGSFGSVVDVKDPGHG